MVVIDKSQEVQNRNKKVIWILLWPTSDYMINTPSMPVAAEPGVYDTKKFYGDKNVSFGDS